MSRTRITATSKVNVTDLESLPLGLRRLWGVSEPSRLGRPAELDVAQVVEAAARIADEHGLAAVSMSRVAHELGYTTMSLYRHVGSKDELLELMFDVAGGPPPDIPAGWRAGLDGWATGLRDMFFARPWAVDVPLTGPPRGPNQVGWMEAGVAALRSTGLDGGEKINVIMLVSGYVRTTVQLILGIRRELDRRGPQVGGSPSDYGATLAALVDSQRYPEVAAIVRDGTFDLSEDQQTLEPDDSDFRFGLDRILDGVAVLIDQRRSAAPPVRAETSPTQ
jgi:AcrR family transcriptional regulator